MPLNLSERSLDWALIHAESQNDTDIFPKIHEFEAMRHDWTTIKAWLQEKDILSWSVRPYRRCLAPKHRFGFRISTQLDPLDFIVFTSLIYEIGTKLESSRISTDQKIVHSYRFKPDPSGRMYSDEYNYRTFQQTSHDICKQINPTHVVIADIADFFPRIYTHRIDNTLDAILGIGHMHAKAIKELISHWAGTYSYGIPVGSAASRLIAEVTISDIDQLLLSEGIIFTRYSDDFRMFCISEAEAYKNLTLLAKILFENHGLTLQQSKTKIVTVEKFLSDYLKEDEKREVDTLSEKFYLLLTKIGIEDQYEDIDFDELTDEQQTAIKQLNLREILTEQIAQEEPDLPILKFLLRRLGQLGDTSALDLVFSNFDKFVPVVKEAIDYTLRLKLISSADKVRFGKIILDIYRNNQMMAAHLDYSRMYLLQPFVADKDWNSSDQYVKLYNDAIDEFSRRQLLLSMGRSHLDFWFRSRKQSLQEMTPWMRRAFIYAASSLPKEEFKHWVRGIDGQLDVLERSIAKWAQHSSIS